MSDSPEQRMAASTRKAKTVAPIAVSAPRPARIGNVAAAVAMANKSTATKPARIDDTFDYEVAFRFAFLGAGQGGGRIANAFYNIGYRRVAVFNTTDSDFNGLAADIQKLTLKTGGSAKDTELARRSLSGREEEVRDLLTKAWGDDVDVALVCVSLGGGTGSGTAPELVRIARQYLKDQGKPARVGAIVSLPNRAEGFQVCRNAVNGFKALQEMGVSPLIVIDNARVEQVYQPAISRVFPTANETVSNYFHLFNQLAAVHSDFITFDKSEFAQLLDSGMVVMGTSDITTIESPADISSAIRDQLAGSVLAQVDLTTGSTAAVLFVAEQAVLDRFTTAYFDAGFTQLNRILATGKPEGTRTVVHRGVYLGADPGLQAYVMVGGLGVPTTLLSDLAKEGGLTAASGSGDGRLATYLGVSG